VAEPTGSAPARLGLRVRILPGSWMSVSCEFCVTGRSLFQRSPAERDVSECYRGTLTTYEEA